MIPILSPVSVMGFLWLPSRKPLEMSHGSVLHVKARIPKHLVLG
jgi:hypothetical protein